MGVRHRTSLMAITASALLTNASSTPTSCSSLTESTCLSAFNASVFNTTHYATGTYNISGTVNLASFCEVHASVKYGNNDTLVFAIWLPDTKYSSRFMAIGNGGQAGVIEYGEMMTDFNLGLGFAVAGSNAGHWAADNMAGSTPGSGAPGVYQEYLHDEDQIKAWLQDGIAIFTPAAKALIKEFYGQEANYSYYRGCSAGGGQGYSLAEFYPDLFDGIIAGGPANWFSHMLLSFLWNNHKTNADATPIPDSVLDFVQAKVLDECDTIDGVEDRLIENPLACSFNISTLACTARDQAGNSTCLTLAQLKAFELVYQGPVRSDSPNTSLYAGLSLGSEAGWSLPQVSGALSNGFSVPIFQNVMFQNLSYDPKTFNWGSDVDLVDERLSPLIDAISPDLSAFRKLGKKMIVYAGWADPNIAPEGALQHVEAVTRRTIGPETTIADNDFLNLVMVPGGGHCGGNIAKYPYIPGQYGVSAAIVEWVERGKAPVKGIKSWDPPNGENRTRRLCTWPNVAKLVDGGNQDDWESYTCGKQ